MGDLLTEDVSIATAQPVHRHLDGAVRHVQIATDTGIGFIRRPAPKKDLYSKKPDNLKGWLDFWIICDQQKAHLFFTSLNGRMWRAETKLTEFPRGFGDPVIALRGDIFEASHTYRLKGLDKYLTLIRGSRP